MTDREKELFTRVGQIAHQLRVSTGPFNHVLMAISPDTDVDLNSLLNDEQMIKTYETAVQNLAECRSNIQIKQDIMPT